MMASQSLQAAVLACRADTGPVFAGWLAAAADPRLLLRRCRQFAVASSQWWPWKLFGATAQALALGVLAFLAWGILFSLIPTPTPSLSIWGSAGMAGPTFAYLYWVRKLYHFAYTRVYVIERNDRRQPWKPTAMGFSWAPRLGFMSSPQAFFGANARSGIVSGYVRLELPYGWAITDLCDLRQLYELPADRHGFSEQPAIHLFDYYHSNVAAGESFRRQHSGLKEMVQGNWGVVLGIVFTCVGFFALLQFTA